ncbi:MAG: dipeptidase [Pyramidobacter sp.]|jgi:membrane dipeptidase
MVLCKELEERARNLHKACFVADAHYDLLNLIASKHIEGGRKDVIATDYLKRLRDGGVNLLISSIFVDTQHVPEMALRRALDQIACLHDELDGCPDVALCRTVSEIRSAAADGRIALLLSFEGIDPIGTDLRLLRVFYELGVRGVGLVWSRRNAAGDGAFFSPRPEGQKGGLTDFGVRVVEEAERLGMYIDVAHLNDEGFNDVLKFSRKPFMASHSNCRALTPVPRNLTDDMIRRLAERGGIMGMNCCGGFVRLEKDGPATAAELSAHGAHVKDLVGAEHLCTGFDFCDEIRRAEGRSPSDAVEYYDTSWQLTANLLMRGFSDEEIQGVLGENLLRFLEGTIG